MSTLCIAGVEFYVWYYPKTCDFTLCWPLHLGIKVINIKRNAITHNGYISPLNICAIDDKMLT